MASTPSTIKKALLIALEKTMGVVTDACRIVKVDRKTFYNYCAADAEFKAQAAAISEVALDFAESQLFKSIKRGSDTATIFFLKTKGKHRGYIERSEYTGKDGDPLVQPMTDTQVDKIIEAIRKK